MNAVRIAVSIRRVRPRSRRRSMRCWRMRLLAPCQQAICVLAEFSRTLLKHGIIRTVNRFHRASGGFFGVLGILARAYAFSAPTRLLTSQFMTVQSCGRRERSEEHTSELQSLMRNSYAVFCLKKKNKKQNN